VFVVMHSPAPVPLLLPLPLLLLLLPLLLLLLLLPVGPLLRLLLLLALAPVLLLPAGLSPCVCPACTQHSIPLVASTWSCSSILPRTFASYR
jgi:hypothetical protein